jgi:exoribonuclease-2
VSEGQPGDLVEIWHGGEIVSAVVLSLEKGRLRVVTERGEEIRITESRIALRAGRVKAAGAGAGARAAAAHADAGRRAAEGVDLPALWEILVDAGGRHTVGSLAELALGSDAPESRSAVIRCLATEKTHFERKGDLWAARGRAAVEQTLQRLRAVAEKERRRGEFLKRVRARLEGAGSAGPTALSPEGIAGAEDAPFLDKVIDLAVHGDDSVHRKEAVGLLEALGQSAGRPALAAFDLLHRLGIFTPDENLEIRRYGLRIDFPDEVTAAAARAASRAPDGPRRDLTHLEAWTVDDEETVEIDDALSWEEEEGGGGVAGIHIADPAAFVEPGDPVDEEALRRASTHYFPDRRLTMLPPAISEEAASLIPGAVRPALSFLATVDPSGAVTVFEVVPSLIRSRARMTYQEADELLASAGIEGGGGAPGHDLRLAPALAGLARIAGVLERGRVAAGAILLRHPEVVVRLAEGRRVVIKRIEERGPSRLLVAELMILANSLAAGFCAERGIVALFRRQAPPDQEPETIPSGPYDPVAVRTLRRVLRRGEVSLSPDVHYALGVPAYLQVTSPLRRYQDLVMQRQVKAWLGGRPLPYEAAEMARIAATTEEGERAARKAETAANGYWILEYLRERVGHEVEGIVITAEPRRTAVEITETLTVASIAPRPDHVPGKRMRLVIEESRPREGLLRLREIDASE